MIFGSSLQEGGNNRNNSFFDLLNRVGKIPSRTAELKIKPKSEFLEGIFLYFLESVTSFNYDECIANHKSLAKSWIASWRISTCEWAHLNYLRVLRPSVSLPQTDWGHPVRFLSSVPCCCCSIWLCKGKKKEFIQPGDEKVSETTFPENLEASKQTKRDSATQTSFLSKLPILECSALFNLVSGSQFFYVPLSSNPL